MISFEGISTGDIKINGYYQGDSAKFSNQHVNDNTRMNKSKKDSKNDMTPESVIYGRR